MSGPVIHRFAGREELAERLSGKIAETLKDGIAARGKATLIVSGGRTPERLFAHLSGQPLDWHKVDVLLADERWVPDDDARSNARFIRETLLTGPAAAAGFSPLWSERDTCQEVVIALDRRLSLAAAPADVVVLGMGEDGHTASLFPDAPELANALRADAPTAVEMSPQSQPEPRISLTPAALTNSRFLVLHIEGDRKWAVLQRALEDGPAAALPVRTILRNDNVTPEVYWCP
ncbi:MAG: 6-phosphogluconolactonase [Pseudomonadota bacterium]